MDAAFVFATESFLRSHCVCLLSSRDITYTRTLQRRTILTFLFCVRASMVA